MKIPRKELGQNFLRSQDKVGELIEVSQPGPDDIYLEIGPGEGVVTRNLSQKVKRIIAVEIDRNLTESLTKSFDKFKNVEIINGDILNYLDLCYYDSNHGSEFNKIIGSIPYQITSPLLHILADLSLRTKLDSVVLLIQKEVANKITAETPHGSYLSNFVQTYFDVSYIKTVPKSAFYPVPKVDGAIVQLEPISQPGGLRRKNSAVEVKKWSAFLHQGFKHPRKMLKKVFDERILKAVGIGPNLRPQDPSLKQWVRLEELWGKF